MAITISREGESLEITCRACEAVNRVPLARLRARPVCGRCRKRLPLDRPFEVTDATFGALVQSSALPVLVDFWAQWCAPCRAVAPELEKVARQKQGELLVAKLDSDKSSQTSSRFGIRAIPTLVLFEGGQEVKRLQGAMSAAQILAELGG